MNATETQRGRGPSGQEFDEFVAAALELNPRGLSGRHRKTQKRSNQNGLPGNHAIGS
jgi:hypothetical protein